VAPRHFGFVVKHQRRLQNDGSRSVTCRARDGGVRKVGAFPCKKAHQGALPCISTSPLSDGRVTPWYGVSAGSTPDGGSDASPAKGHRRFVIDAGRRRYRREAPREIGVNGRTLVFQTKGAGSIPASRSIVRGQRKVTGLRCHRRFEGALPSGRSSELAIE
jgi:hypothetical protein